MIRASITMLRDFVADPPPGIREFAKVIGPRAIAREVPIPHCFDLRDECAGWLFSWVMPTNLDCVSRLYDVDPLKS